MKHDPKKDVKAVKTDKTPQHEIANNLSSKLNEVEVTSTETKEDVVREIKGETEKKVIECIVDKKEIAQPEAEVKTEPVENKSQENIEHANSKVEVKEEVPVIIPHNNSQETTKVVTCVYTTDTTLADVAEKVDAPVEQLEKKEVANHENINNQEIEKNEVKEEIIEPQVEEKVLEEEVTIPESVQTNHVEKVEEKEEKNENDSKEQLNLNEKMESAEIQQVETTNSSQEDKQSEIKSEEKEGQPTEIHNQENSEVPAN